MGSSPLLYDADPLCFQVLIVPAGKLVSLQGRLFSLLSYNIPRP